MVSPDDHARPYAPRVIERIHLLLLQLFRRVPRRGRLAIVHALAPHYSVGAMCIIERDDGRMLLVRHAYRNRWGVPGGLLNRGEDPRSAAARETLEETGLAIETVGEPSVVVDPGPRRVDIVFRARPAAGADPDAARPTSVEIVEAAWFKPEELPELQFETAGALDALRQRLNGSGPTSPYKDDGAW